MQNGNDLVDPGDRLAIDGEEHVARLQPGPRGARPGRHFRGHDVVAGGAPQHAVLDLAPPGALDDVRHRKREEQDDDAHLGRRTHPHAVQGGLTHYAYTLYPAGRSKAHTPERPPTRTGKTLILWLLAIIS